MAMSSVMSSESTPPGARPIGKTGPWTADAAESCLEGDLSDADSDETLMARVRAGDREAFRILVTRHVDRIVGLARRMLGNAEAEDIAQEVFLKVWTRRAQWRPAGGAFRTWLYRVALNQCIDRTRKRVPVPLDEAPEVPDQADGPLEVCDARETAARLRAALQMIPERQRIAITLYYHEDLTAAQVATIMSLKLNAVESLLKRGRQNLRALLG